LFSFAGFVSLTLGACGGGGGGGNHQDAGSDGTAQQDSAAEMPAPTPDSGADAVVDAAPPPTMLMASITDRRQVSVQLVWPVPSGGVAGYQIRYAKVPITATNFGDTTVTTNVPFTGTPAPPGTGDGLLVKNLYVETDYYFGVQGVNGTGGAVGALMTTATATRSKFQTSILTSPSGTNQLFGAVIDGSGDVNGDGLSDVLIGTSNDTHAYLYLGATGFSPNVPAVTFTGANPSFGANVKMIGDIDKDGLEDLAISDSTANRVLIYKGRTTWPATLTDSATDASYIITTDATWAASGFGLSMAGLGDFNGDGTDDFAIGAPGFNASVGRVAVIYGRTGFTSFGLPDTTRSLEIGGDPALNRTQFGLAVAGLGHFYTPTGTTLVVSGPGVGAATSTSNNEGRIYGFHGRGPGAAIDATAADNNLVGPGKGAKIGQILVNLGPLVNATPSLGTGNTADTLTLPGMTGSAFVFSGTTTTGPFATKLVVFQTGGTAPGQVIFGGSVSGSDKVVSMIGGDAKADLGLTGLSATSVDIVDGNHIAALTSPADLKAAADVHVPLPTGWMATAAGAASLIPDVNGDGYPDFAMGDQFGAVPGRVAVFW
jgi:hypothetical protein